MDADDSDFYGDEDTKRLLQQRVDDFDTDAWHEAQRIATGRPLCRANPAQEAPRLHNPYAGVAYAWQLSETVDTFLARLPPSTTEQSEHVPWIFICNPYISREGKRQSDHDILAGNEDEGPAEQGNQLRWIVQGGVERLQLLKSFHDKMEGAGERPSVIQREMRHERKQAALDILNLAHAGKVRTGKWLLFCPPSEVDETWAVVAKATADNELGIAAKVAPRSPVDDPRRDRLICVYTANFQDRADVGRVLQRLRELRLVEAKGRAIYYKPDVFTYIGVSHGNPWGLAASMYSSRDVL